MLIIPQKNKVVGRGLLNTLINKLPFGLEVPGYEYCGPGTKIEEKVSKNVPGRNLLDEACKVHDIAYWRSKDLATRHEADRELQERAWERFKAKDSSFGEKAVSYLVTNAMRAKLAMGAGVGKQKKLRKSKKRGEPKTTRGAGVYKRGKANKRKRTLFVGRVIPLPKRGGILQYLIPLLSGLSNIAPVAGTVSDLLKSIQTMRGKGIKKRGVLAPFKKGFGLYLKPYSPNC